MDSIVSCKAISQISSNTLLDKLFYLDSHYVERKRNLQRNIW